MTFPHSPQYFFFMQVMSGLLPRKASSLLDPSFPFSLQSRQISINTTPRGPLGSLQLFAGIWHTLYSLHYSRTLLNPARRSTLQRKPVWRRYANVLSVVIPPSLESYHERDVPAIMHAKLRLSRNDATSMRLCLHCLTGC